MTAIVGARAVVPELGHRVWHRVANEWGEAAWTDRVAFFDEVKGRFIDELKERLWRAGIIVNDYRPFDDPDRQPIAHWLTDDGTGNTICGHNTFKDGEPASWWIYAAQDHHLWWSSRDCKNCLHIRKRRPAS